MTEQLLYNKTIQKFAKTLQAELIFEAYVPSKWSFSLLSEAGLVHLFKTFRLLREIQISNEEWDKTVYIVGDASEIKDLFLKFPDLQKSTYALIKKGFRIEFNQGSIKARKICDSVDHANKDMEGMGPTFEELFRTMKKVKESGLDQSFDPNQALFIALLAASIILALGVLIYAGTLVEHNIIHLPGVAGFYGFVLGGFTGFLALVVWRIIRRLHSRSHYEFTILFALLPFSFAIAGSTSSLYVNRILDHDKGTIVDATVSRAYTYRNKHGQVFYTLVYTFPVPESIKKSYKSSHFDEPVTGDVYASTKVGDKKFIRVFPGFYGQPWILK